MQEKITTPKKLEKELEVKKGEMETSIIIDCNTATMP